MQSGNERHAEGRERETRPGDGQGQQRERREAQATQERHAQERERETRSGDGRGSQQVRREAQGGEERHQAHEREREGQPGDGQERHAREGSRQDAQSHHRQRDDQEGTERRQGEHRHPQGQHETREAQSRSVAPAQTTPAQTTPAQTTPIPTAPTQTAPATVTQPTHQPVVTTTATLPSAPPADATPVVAGQSTADPASAAPATATPATTDAPAAVASTPTFDAPMMGVGGPRDRDVPDDRQATKATTASVPANAQAKKPGSVVGRFSTHLPPPSDVYRQREFLISKPSLKLLEELRRRGYLVGPSNGAGLLLVTLPPDGSNAWDVQRELEASFPDTRLGLNYVYRTYKPYRGASQPEMLPKGTARKGCSAELCYGPDVIHWDKKLAVCAAGLKVGMIDTSIDEAHPAFPPKGLKVFDLARKQDAPPAVHWHGTGVLSLMAGVADSSTPGLIPGAAFSAANVFFTNKDGELETDTAHLTEALAAMKGEGVRVVNMSLVGPQDVLVHERIIDMATNDGVVFVAAAGNGGPDALPGYPAAYAEVIAVTAVDRNRASYDHANRGTYIDMAAPGVQILAALPGGKEGLLSGTSFAAPFVTAVVAVAYRDTGLEKAAKEGRGRLDPKGVMLSHLFRKDELQTRSPIKGYGLVRAPEKCGSGGGSDSWASVVKPTPSVPTAATVLARPAAGSIALDSWQGQTIVQQASLPAEAAK